MAAKQTSNWYVITGAPSAGKSTVIELLAKKGYKTFSEVGRSLIDQDMAKGMTLEEIRVDSPEFEFRFVQEQLKRETKLSRKDLIFFDRGILDTLGFHRHYGWKVPPRTQACCDKATYNQTVFLLEMGEYEKDYARVESATSVKKLQKLSGQVYAELGYNVISIPRASVEKRVELILGTIGEKV